MHTAVPMHPSCYSSITDTLSPLTPLASPAVALHALPAPSLPSPPSLWFPFSPALYQTSSLPGLGSTVRETTYRSA